MNTAKTFFERPAKLLKLINENNIDREWKAFDKYDLMRELNINTLKPLYDVIDRLNNIDKNCIINNYKNNIEIKYKNEIIIEIKSKINSIFQSEYYLLRKEIIDLFYKEAEIVKLNEVELSDYLKIERTILQSAKTLYRELIQLKKEEMDELKEKVKWDNA